MKTHFLTYLRKKKHGYQVEIVQELSGYYF